jgi:hypothetical protein
MWPEDLVETLQDMFDDFSPSAGPKSVVIFSIRIEASMGKCVKKKKVEIYVGIGIYYWRRRRDIAPISTSSAA